MTRLRAARAAIQSFLESQGLSESHPHVVLAGAAMYAHGLRSDFGDIDLYVPGLSGEVEETHNGIKIDAKPWLGVGKKDLGERALRECQLIDGLRVMCPQHILEMKLAMNREKDQQDIDVLKKLA